MQNTQSFGACLKNILENRDLSVVEASRILNMKSPTSLARILHNEVNIKTLERFYHQLIQAAHFALTPEEKDQLNESLKIQSLGQDEYFAQQSLWNLLLPASSPSLPSPRLVCFQKNLACRPESLAQLFALYTESRKAHLILCGCCLPAFLSSLPAPLPAHITVTHYLRTHAGSCHSMAAALTAIRPLLPLANYSAYIADREKLPPEVMACYGKNEFLCAFEDNQGKQRWHHGILLDSNQIMLMEYRCEAQFSFQAHPFSHYQARLAPVKPLFFSSPPPECYVDYIRYFQQLEQDREIYALKPDLPIHFIHPDLLLAATLAALPGAPFGNASQLDDLLKRMYALQAQRWKNIFKKRKVTHIIFSFQAMQEFARTGVQTDHFFGMRPFTPSERKSILAHLRRQMLENPYFNIHFAFNEMIPFQLELCGYDSGGVLLSSTTTSYDLSIEYMDAMILQQDFFKTYKNFFLQELLPARVHSGKEALAMMDQVMEAIPEEI